MHSGRVVKGSVKTGAAVELKVDHQRRTRLRANHSATHLVHEALREVLGSHVAQKGSLVAPDRLRFDFSHNKPISAGELERVEAMANEVVVQNSPVSTRLMSVDDAIAEGAMALFGEKYGDEVRVVSMGTGLEGDKAGKPYSVELCGGTHVSATGDIGLVRLVHEGAVAAGVRRIEALTGEAARLYLDEQDRRLKAAASALKVAPADVPMRVEALLDERRKLERELSDARKKLALGGGSGDGGSSESETVAGIRFHRQVRDRCCTEGLEVACRCRKIVARFGRGGFRRRQRGRQGQCRGGGDRRSDRTFQRRRPGARGFRGTWRAGWWRQT